MLTRIKEFFELAYWKYVKLFDKRLKNAHYQYFYTEYFNFSLSDYSEKSILDIGCGPRGSLEWANVASKRVGLDPLAEKYLKLGASKHKMEYVKGYSENIPFADNSFDFVCSFNSFDHVVSLQDTANEIKRVLKPGGFCLLIVDIHDYATLTEPQKTNWNLVQDYFSDLECVEEKHLAVVKKHSIYQNLREHAMLENSAAKDGVLTVKMMKK